MPDNGRIRPAIVLIALTLASACLVSIPELITLSRRAREIAGSSEVEKRERLLGDLYSSIVELDRALPADRSIAIVMKDYRDADGGVFANYHTYPRRTRFYYDLDVYRNDANGPGTIWYIDLDRSDRVRQMTYEQVRLEQSREWRPVSPMTPFVEIDGMWIIPFAAAVDGAAQDRYTTEMVLESDRNTTVDLTLFPDAVPVSLEIDATRPTRIVDLMSHAFGRTGVGWLRITSESRVRVGAWLTNRRSGVAVPIRLYRETPRSPIHFPGAEKLWIVNPRTEALVVQVNGASVALEPTSLTNVAASPDSNIVAAPERVIAFASRKEVDGNTTFFWPEDSP